MSPKEAPRAFVIEQTTTGHMTVRQAAEYLNITERQVYRLKGGVKKEGLAALAHKNRGRKPRHAISDEVRSAVATLALTLYQGASLEHMSELLAAHHQITLSPKTIGRIFKQAGIKNTHTHKASRKRRSRERAVSEGLLVQCDASPFLWLGDRGPMLTLHGAVDDATGKILALHLRPNEDSLGYFEVLRQVLAHFGVPRYFYTDGSAIFFSAKSPSIEEQLAGKSAPLTHFGRALDKLGIHPIRARSPQAKGRIERLWGTLQHRLVVELRIAKVASLDEANAFFPSFIHRFNQRFAIPSDNSEPAFRTTPSPALLSRILCFEYRRKADHGSTLSFEGLSYQLFDKNGQVLALQPKTSIRILRHLDGFLEASYANQYYALQRTTKAAPIVLPKPLPKSTAHVPPLEHPWKKRSFDQMIRTKQLNT